VLSVIKMLTGLVGDLPKSSTEVLYAVKIDGYLLP
jgi:hypothetical protein